MSSTFCPRCGAEFPVEVLGELIRTSVRCPDCRLALTEIPDVLAPSEEEVGYELSDWPVTERGPVTAALIEAEIRFRWESGLVLVVPEAAEEQVDRLLDELESEAAEAASAGGDEDEAGDGEEEQDGGEAAQEAMSDLFVAADRLQHSPFDEGFGSALREAAAVVDASLPPYGMERRVWRQIQEQAGAIVSDLDKGADDEIVADKTRELREFLREYV